jgi:hypothetical protein
MDTKLQLSLLVRPAEDRDLLVVTTSSELIGINLTIIFAHSVNNILRKHFSFRRLVRLITSKEEITTTPIDRREADQVVSCW